MNGPLKPVGELPPEVYWRRRIVIITVLVLMVVVIWFLATAPRGGPSSDEGNTANPTASPEVTTSASPGSTVDVARPCDANDVAITTTPNPNTFPAGSLPVFDVTITMNGLSPCKLTASPETSELLITSGSDRIYSSTDCPNDATINTREFILQPDSPDEMFQVTWNRQRSAPGCTTVTSEPQPGTYHVVLTIQGISSEDVTFVLA